MIVVNFHKIADQSVFKKIIEMILKKYTPSTIDDLKDVIKGDRYNKRKMCYLTIDDGDKTFYENAFPLLIKENIPFSLFISPKIFENGFNYWFQEIDFIKEKIGNDRFYEAMTSKIGNKPIKTLKINEIIKLVNDLKEHFSVTKIPSMNISLDMLMDINSSEISDIGAHTMNHPILLNETKETSEFEIVNSIRQLEKLLKRKINTFAYPNGLYGYDFSDREISILKENDIHLAFATQPGVINKKTNRYLVPRIGYTVNREKMPKYSKIKLNIPKYWKYFYLPIALKSEGRSIFKK